jgi:hypothetical protein
MLHQVWIQHMLLPHTFHVAFFNPHQLFRGRPMCMQRMSRMSIFLSIGCLSSYLLRFLSSDSSISVCNYAEYESRPQFASADVSRFMYRRNRIASNPSDEHCSHSTVKAICPNWTVYSNSSWMGGVQSAWNPSDVANLLMGTFSLLPLIMIINSV